MLLGHPQRLDAERIAGERQGLGVTVPDRGRIHAFEPKPGIVAPADISGEQVSTSLPVRNWIWAPRVRGATRVIDDLAVADDRTAAVGAVDGLVATRDVDDAETAHAEAEIAVDA